LGEDSLGEVFGKISLDVGQLFIKRGFLRRRPGERAQLLAALTAKLKFGWVCRIAFWA